MKSCRKGQTNVLFPDNEKKEFRTGSNNYLYCPNSDYYGLEL